MTNNYYATYSTSSSQFLDSNTPQLISTDHLNKNPLRASEIVATSKQSSNVVKLPLEELQMRFVLFAAEIDRLLILNSLTNKEADHWRKKYLNSENLSPPKESETNIYKQKYNELEVKYDALYRNNRVISDTLAIKEREIEDLKRGNFFSNQKDKDQEIEFWRTKAAQAETEFFHKIQNIKIQTENALREKIEGEVKTALQRFEDEKNALQKRINDLTAENQSLKKSSTQYNSSDNDGAYWREKYNTLEASFDSKIKSTMQSKLHETLTPIVKENESLFQQLAFYKEKFEESETKYAALSSENKRLIEESRGQLNGYNNWSIGNNQNIEKEKKAGYNSSPKTDEHIIRAYEDKINTLEKEKQTLVAGIQEYEERVQGLMKDNNLLSDHLREISEKENQLYDNARAKENLELQKQSLQETVKRLEVKLKENEEIIRSLNEELSRQNQEFEMEKYDYENALEVVRKKLVDFERLLAVVENENERLKYETNPQNEKELQELKKLTIIMENETEMWKGKYKALEQETQAYIDKTLEDVEMQFRGRIEQEKESHSAKLISEKNKLESQLRMSEQKLKEIESKSANLGRENHELLLVNKELSQELKEYKNRLENSSRETNAKINELQRAYEQESKGYMEKEIQKLQLQLQDKISSYEKENERLVKLVQQYEVRQILFFIEIERLYVVNGEFIQEINTITDEINFLANENEGLNQRLTEVTNLNDNFKYDKIKYEELISELKEQIEDSQKRIQLLMVENTRLSDSAIVRLKEIDNLKHSITSKTSTKYESPKKSEAEITELTLKYEKEKSVLEAQISQLKQTIDINLKEMNKLHDINHQRKQENENLYQELENTKEFLWKVQNQESEIRVQKDQFEQLFKEVEEMRKARDFYKQQFEQVSAKLKGYYNDKIKETLPPNHSQNRL